MNKKRPVNLDLTRLKFPAMAISSILHRISGIVLFLFLPLILFVLEQSLQSEQTFTQTKILLRQPGCKMLLWACGAAVICHVLAGLRHLLMDLGWGEDLHSGRLSAIAVILLTAVLTIFLGIWIW